MHAAFIKLICSTTGAQSRKMRLDICRMLEDWARRHGYDFRNLYPGIHEPYRNPMSGQTGPHPDTFDYPVTYLLAEGPGAYDQLAKETVLMPEDSGGSLNAHFQAERMRWITDDREWPLAPDSQEMSIFKMPWQAEHMSRTEMAVQLSHWPDKSITVTCCESRHLSQNVETARHMLRSVLYSSAWRSKAI